MKQPIDVKKAIELIDTALAEADRYVSEYYRGEYKYMNNAILVLNLLKEEIRLNYNDYDKINRRVLRGMCDIAAVSAKSYEDSGLGVAISSVSAMLWNTIPKYKRLEPLRMDFGKGDPI